MGNQRNDDVTCAHVMCSKLNGHMGRQHLWEIKEKMTSLVLIAHVGQLNGHMGRQYLWEIKEKMTSHVHM